jgi:DNA-binding MarR family transcriptional regulator
VNLAFCPIFGAHYNRKTREILMAIKAAGTYPGVTKLAEHVELSPDQTKRRLDDLVNHGLVRMQLHKEEDRQWYLIKLTPEGEERLQNLTYSVSLF